MEFPFEQIYREALSKVSLLETWPGYFLTKKTETEIIFNKFLLKQDNGILALEIGCGNAFQAALLSSFVGRVVATDLFNEDPASHTVGMMRARMLLDSLHNKKVSLVSCSSVALPFPGDHFDLVFASSSLEHVADRVSALREMQRVLKPGGELIIVVPTHMPSVYAFPHVFLYCLARIGKLIFQGNSGNPLKTPGGERGNERRSLLQRFRNNHPSFPLPEPHGSYRNIAEELRAQLPANWIKLLRQSGFAVNDSIAIGFLPWLLIEPFSTFFAAKAFAFTKGINISLADFRGAAYLSYLIGIKAAKVDRA